MRSSTSTRRACHHPRPLFLEWLECRVVPSFLPPVNYATGGAPRSVALGDVNNDSGLDVATVNEAGRNASVLLGNGDGSFQPARNFPAGERPSSVAMGDFNRDGFLDLTVADPFEFWVRVNLGNGDGTFQAARLLAPQGGPRGVAAADVNGDANLDVIAAASGVSVFLGNGNGTFQSARNFTAGMRPTAVAVADVNGDQLLDLVVANQNSNNVSVHLGNGDGTFRAALYFPAGREPLAVAAGDVSGDGLPDLAVGGFPFNTVSVLLGNGDGTFQDVRNILVGGNPQSVAIGDMNGDGLLDVVTGNTNNAVGVLLSSGGGTFQAVQNFPAGSFPSSVAVGDVNGDGFADVAVANLSSSNVSILLNDGYWGGPAISFYIYPDSGIVTTGQPFDVYVLALNASFEIVTNYTGEILFYATDPLATTPVFYQFQLADRGIASFPGGLTFNTVGMQELYVFDYPAIQVFGYAAFEVVGTGPSGGGAGGALDAFAAEALAGRHTLVGSHPSREAAEGSAPAKPDESAATADDESRPELGPAAATFRAAAGPQRVRDHLFVTLAGERPTWGLERASLPL